MPTDFVGTSKPSRRAGELDAPLYKRTRHPRASRNFMRNVAGATLRNTLDRLVRLIEYQVPAMHGSILLLDDDGVTLRHGAAPHLPEAYCHLIDGAHIGPIAGSCGTAAYHTGERPDSRTMATLKANGITDYVHSARKV
jgi:hypothetical protein